MATDLSLKLLHSATFGVSRISENSDLVVHQSDQWTNDHDYGFGFGERHTLVGHIFPLPRLGANHHVLAGEKTVIHSELPISDLW